MTHDKAGGPAFPSKTLTAIDLNDGTATELEAHTPGMTLRDWFAGQALAVALDAKDKGYFDGGNNEIAEAAYQIADAMLREREDTTND